MSIIMIVLYYPVNVFPRTPEFDSSSAKNVNFVMLRQHS